jgi:hypothetical protein
METEKQNNELYLYKNLSSIPRGYNNIISTKMNFYSVEYSFPIAYPDFNVGSLVYLKRIRTGLFYDCAEGPGNSFYKPTVNGLSPLYTTSEKTSFQSFGFELLADFHLFRIPYMISGGVQSAWKTAGSYPSIELLFNINLYGMTFGRKQI